MTLRRCPFCGGLNLQVGKDPECVERYQWRVICFDCMTVGPLMPSQDEAKAAWNRREPDYEQKWSELVETTGRRIAQDAQEKHE